MRRSSGRGSPVAGPEGRRQRQRRSLLRELRSKIEALEARTVPPRLQQKIVHDLAHALFDILDADKNGSIEQDEYSDYAGILSQQFDNTMQESLDRGSRVKREDFVRLVKACADEAGKRQFVARLRSLEARLSGEGEQSFPIDPLYSDLHTSSGCTIAKTEHRGITLKQLGALKAHILRRCEAEGWTDRSARSPTHGQQLSPSAVNLYQACDWVVQPATKRRQCSYVELVAGHPQLPRWFVSHWWGEAVFDFVTCLTQHANDRNLGLDCPYWVCAYANNQWKLDQELVDDLEQTSFRKAMSIAEGTVSVLDKHAVCYSRVWCCYEVHTSIMTLRSTSSAPYRYDMYTALADDAVGISDGFAAVDLASRIPADGKFERERSFPPLLMEQALHISLEHASATAESDKRRILNFIAGARDMLAEPLQEHPLYDELNDTLRGRFAAAGLRTSLESEARGEACLAVLAKSRLQKLTLSFYNSEEMTDSSLLALASSLPRSLRELDLDLSFCIELTDGGVCSLVEFLSPDLQRLALSFCGCNSLTDCSVSALAATIRSMPLHDLSLNFYGNKSITDDSMQELIAAIPKGLRRLAFDVSFCWKLSDISVTTLAANLCTSMRELEINLRTLSLTEDAVKTFAKALPPHVERLILDLRFCEALGDASAEAIAVGLPQGLQYLLLHLWSWPRLTDHGVQAIAAGLPKALQQLDLFLGENPLITDLGVKAVTSALGPALRELLLKFSSCPLLTLAGSWKPLAKAIPLHLQRLELWIDGCSESSKAKEFIQEALKDRNLGCEIHG